MLLRFASVALVLLVTACSSSTSDTSAPPPSPDSGTSDSGAAEGGACGALDVASAPVTVTTSVEAPPSAQGGALSDGTFLSTGGVLYVGPGGDASAKEDPLAATIRIEGTRGEILREGVVRVATFATSGTTLTTTGICPSTKVDAVEYTATSSTLVIHVKRSAGTLVETFTRQ